MLNALSRAAIGALKAGKSNLTPKIVHNELPKAMVATTSTCEYDGTFSAPRFRKNEFEDDGAHAVGQVFSVVVVVAPRLTISRSVFTVPSSDRRAL